MRFRGLIKKWVYENVPVIRGSFPYFGTRVYFPKNSVIFRMACEQGIYEWDNLRLMRRLLEPGTVYLDIGANIGLMSVPILKYCTGSKVVSIEASPDTARYLESTWAGSGYCDRWVIVNEAVGEVPGTNTYYCGTDEFGAFDGSRDTGRGGEKKAIIVNVTTVDRIWTSLDRPQVSLIKLDIEGGEYDALLGAMNCLRETRPAVLLEWNPVNLRAYDRSQGSLVSLADSIGYDIYSVPRYMPVMDNKQLSLEMIMTETFLVLPKEAQMEIYESIDDPSFYKFDRRLAES